MTSYCFYYRCRLCGKVFAPSGVCEKQHATAMLATSITDNKIPVTIHVCDEHDLGVADLIGAKPAKPCA